jgi:hypothetical protein
MTEGRVYHCQNRVCDAEILVTKASCEASANPRCGCGAEMKKPYNPPVLRILDRDDELVSRLETGRGWENWKLEIRN